MNDPVTYKESNLLLESFEKRRKPLTRGKCKQHKNALGWLSKQTESLALNLGVLLFTSFLYKNSKKCYQIVAFSSSSNQGNKNNNYCFTSAGTTLPLFYSSRKVSVFH